MIFNMSTGGASTADKVKYNNTESGLKSTDVQGAIDEVNSSLNDFGKITLLCTKTLSVNSSITQEVSNIDDYKFVYIAVGTVNDNRATNPMLIPVSILKLGYENALSWYTPIQEYGFCSIKYNNGVVTFESSSASSKTVYINMYGVK